MIEKFAPYVGLLLLFLGLLFGVLSVADYPTTGDSNKYHTQKNYVRFGQLSLTCVLIGGFLLLTPINK